MCLSLVSESGVKIHPLLRMLDLMNQPSPCEKLSFLCRERCMSGKSLCICITQNLEGSGSYYLWALAPL